MSKILTTMSRCIILILLACNLSYAYVKGQNNVASTKVSINLKDATLVEIFSNISLITPFNFAYSEYVINYPDKFTIKYEDISLQDLLDKLSQQASFDIHIDNEIILIKKKPAIGDSNKVNSVTQQIEISGKVTDENGEPLVGASIVEKGTSNGTISDVDGNFSLTVSIKNVKIEVTYVGYITQVFTITKSEYIVFELKIDSKFLSEVVVIGYGKEKKSLLSDAVTSINSDQISNLPIPAIDGVLQGQAPGVQVTQNSGTPGGEMSVRIRGLSSINGSNQPLYIIDGIPVTTGDFGQIGYSGQGTNALSDLNPSDIETISVLKDASATSIYGARASNGIVLITTKRGKSDKSSVEFNAYRGVQNVWRKLELLNAREWMEYRNDLTKSTVFTKEQMGKITVDTDWQNEIFRSASIGSYDISTTGGNDKTKFFLNGNFFNQEGILIGTDYKRYNGRINVDHHISDKLTVGTSIGLSHAKTNRVESDQTLHGPLPNGISTPSIFPVYNKDGSYNQKGPYANAISIAKETINENFSYRTNSNIYAEYQIIDELSFSTKWGVDFLSFREHSYGSTKTVQGAKYNGLGFETYNHIRNLVSNNLLKFNKQINKSRINALLGYSFESYQKRSSYIRGQDFADDDLEYINSAATIVSAKARATDTGIRSFLGRVKYSFDEKYIVTFSGRFDTSTKFGENNRTGFFPAVSLAWRITEEKFMENIDKITNFKIRASYGITGNDDISPFLYSELYGNTTYGGKSGIYPSNIPNPNLKWENTKQLNIGFDIGLFENKISITGDYYDKHTDDLLFKRPIPRSSGYSSITENIGKVENKGIELSLSSNNISNQEFEWNSILNFSSNRNRVLKLYNGQPIDNIGRGGNRIMEGQPIGIFYSYESLGVDPSTGDVVFKDTNFDGKITSKDRTIVGNPHPDFIYGLTNNFRYKGFDLSVFVQGSYGNDVFNGTRLFLESLQGGDNQLKAITKRWKKPGDVTNIPRATTDPVKATQNKNVSSRFIEDGSFLRIKNVTLGYTLRGDKYLKSILESVRLYLTVQNLFTFTNYLGYDPEVNYRGDHNSVIGTDFFTYPQAKTFIIGINIKL